MSTSAVPPGFHSVNPYLIVENAAEAIEFYKRVFGAEERGRFEHGGKIMHAEFVIGDSVVSIADAFPERGINAPASPGDSACFLFLYVEDVDAVFRQAIAAGATEKTPVENQFYGDRSGSIIDPFGHAWTIATHVEDISIEELNARAAAMFPQDGGEAGAEP